jgi:hypothetical protein
MPRAEEHIIIVRPWPPLKPGKSYKGQIKEVRINKKSKTLRVTLVNLDPSMLDRLHSVELPLPPRPGNRASRFLSACGQPGEEVGSQTEIDCLIDAVVNMRFIPAGDGYEIEFERFKNSDWAERGRDNPSAHSDRTGADEAGWER